MKKIAIVITAFALLSCNNSEKSKKLKDLDELVSPKTNNKVNENLLFFDLT